MTGPIHIVATGARTPLGLQAASAAAAVRARISALKQHPFMVDSVGDLMPGAFDAEIAPHVIGTERMLILAETALREVCAPLESISASHTRLPLYIGLPEHRPGFSNKDAETLRTGIEQIQGLPIHFAEIKLFLKGHAAGFSALTAAIETIKKGRYDACLVGGVDSYFHPDTMEWLDANRQLVGAVSRSGFVPGEGAGFCLVMTEQACTRIGIKILACVREVGLGKETKLIKTTDMCLGEGLTATVRNAINSLHLPTEKINTIFCDVNGERYRSEEWGFVCLRLGQYFDDPAAYLSPAECWGDMGAASAPLFAMLACQAFERGYSEGSRTMLWASSESGERGVAVLDAMIKVSR